MYQELSKWMDDVMNFAEEIRVSNSSGGVKNDGNKLRPGLLFKSMPKAVLEVIKVLDAGATEYGANNWKLVEDERYHEALLRHVILGYFQGEQYDAKSKLHHLAHAVCCSMFLLEKELEGKYEEK